MNDSGSHFIEKSTQLIFVRRLDCVSDYLGLS